MCGIFGVFNHTQAAELTYFGLHSLQHRGQESAGICVSDGEKFHTHRGTGLVTEAFGQDQHLQLAGHIGIGHVRYTTAGDSGLLNAQPLVFRYTGGRVAVAHNGNLVNAKRLRNQLESKVLFIKQTVIRKLFRISSHVPDHPLSRRFRMRCVWLKVRMPCFL